MTYNRYSKFSLLNSLNLGLKFYKFKCKTAMTKVFCYDLLKCTACSVMLAIASHAIVRIKIETITKKYANMEARFIRRFFKVFLT